ncbi:glucose-6-phosphate isomerase [Elusimicrobium posterum]|uniref:glucose-6-phosphate isomerase n=1 Tax=Elusimicrobium posterum TaxID=3116653 RepID=UPI003C718E87
MKFKVNSAADSFIREGMFKLEGKDFLAKLYEKDATVWKTEEDHVKIINNSLGWLTVYEWTMEKLPEVLEFADAAKKDFTHCVVLGMGGSSLAPEVFRVLFGKQKGYPELVVLDSTNADWVGAVKEQIKVETTLFIFASKSGGTVEPSSQFAYFYNEVSKTSKTPGDNFIAITDPGTGLETLAKEKKFRKIFVNRADIGGRFSALSLFGMVPAAISGIDVKKILESAKREAETFGPLADPKHNAALRLGALMGGAVLKRKDKLTVLMPKEIETFGLWIEQLVAESTGKEGKGVVPVVGENTYEGFDFKDDRVFVNIDFDSRDNDRIEDIVEGLQETQHPLFQVEMDDEYEIGAQMLMWEIATAAAGAIMGVDPFDQPNVQEAKTMAKDVLTGLAAGKEDADTKKLIITSKALEDKIELATLAQDVYSVLESNDYVAILAYVGPSKEIEETLLKLRDEILAKTKRAVMFGYGPRYLHSTGQLHKGDGNNGVFLIFSADAENDIKIPGQNYTFGDLASAQALGDFKALDAKGRRAIKIHLSKPVLSALKKIDELF